MTYIVGLCEKQLGNSQEYTKCNRGDEAPNEIQLQQEFIRKKNESSDEYSQTNAF